MYELLFFIAIIFAATSVVMLLAILTLLKKIDNKNAEDCNKKNLNRHEMLTIINNINAAIINMDEHGIITMFNAAALDMIDTNETIEGEHISEVLNLETVEHESIDIFKELTKSSAIRQRDDLIITIEDEEIRLEVTFAPVQDGDQLTPDGYVLILRDVTKKKNLEEERDEFISVVSHELRTPITIAEGSLSNAKILIERHMNDKIPAAIDESHKQVLFLARMVNDLSTLSRAERGVSDEKEVIDLIELAKKTNDEYSPQATEKGIAFNLDIDSSPGSVEASRLYLEELLQNFITNAIRYTQKGSITLSIKKDKSGNVRFAVKDSGIGISKADLSKIFDKFYRAEDYRTRETNGTGLGLYVSAKLARKLGCKIEVESRLNHGSTFSFKLPQHKK